MADHGIQITRTEISPPPVPTLGAGVVGIVGTAPDADPDGAFGKSVTLNTAEFSSVTTQAALTALSSAHWAVITVSGDKYLAFKSPTAADERVLSGLKVGNKITVSAVGGSTAVLTFTVEATYNTTNDRIEINSTADASSLTDGTSYDVKANEIDYDTPFRLNTRADAPTADLGDDGTLPDGLNGIYRQGNVTVWMSIVRVGSAVAPIMSADLSTDTFSTITSQSTFDSATLAGERWAVIHEGSHRFLAFKDVVAADETLMGMLAPGRQISVKADGGSTVLQTFTIEGDYDTTHDRIEINRSASTTGLTNGTDYDLATVAVARVTANDATRLNLLGRESQLTGIYALMSVDPTPTIVCVGSTLATSRPSSMANILASGLVEIAGKINAIAVLDGPNGTQAQAATFAGDFDSPRAYLVDPGVVTADGSVPASPSVAGLMAATDFWVSPSNMPINGVTGLGRLIDKTRAQALNDDFIATIIRRNGFRLWGNETLATATGVSYRFVNIQRTADAIEASLIAAHQWAIDRNITERYFQLVAQSCQNFLDKLTAQGAITGGVCYPDDSKNTVASIQEGQVYFQIEWSGSYPAQTLNINMELSGRFLEELLANL